MAKRFDAIARNWVIFWLFGNYCENGIKMTIGIM
jgi:hypothetical protein